MDAGDLARESSGDNSILALGAASWIGSKRDSEDGIRKHAPRRACIVKSLKHPDEVSRLRDIYPQGFYLIHVYADPKRRKRNLVEDRRISEAKAAELMLRDENEDLAHGQRMTDTFHLSDFFIRFDGDEDRLKSNISRITELIYGNPHLTPTFDEFAMFMAFASSLRSADLARQVGAVVARDEEVVASGANDCPRFGGGLYWPAMTPTGVRDTKLGRDHTRGFDANTIERLQIVDEIVASGVKAGLDEAKLRTVLADCRIHDLTEFGRVVHAEMEAILSCARNGISPKGATLYCTTFPCHNCAKHIVAAGIHRVVYVEPYPKSKAGELHDDSIAHGFDDNGTVAPRRVRFEPFVGIGPRRFFDLFSMRLGSGRPLRRKDKDGKSVPWQLDDGVLRIQMRPHSYLDLESWAGTMFKDAVSQQGGDA